MKQSILVSAAFSCIFQMAAARADFNTVSLEQELSKSDGIYGLTLMSENNEFTEKKGSFPSPWLDYELSLSDERDFLYEGIRTEMKAVSSVSLDSNVDRMLQISDSGD